ncbi:MAG: RNA pseudouridine synthase, partial [Lachnospiraceae bacterium]|nr:RNA pseudouridine synthase [Lachnospiraceae bacterium]
DKFYLALVKGTGIKESTLSGYLNKDSSANKVIVKLGDKEEIRTDIKPVSDNGKITLVEAELFTGKTHQIRASLAALGHPLIGDYKYGDRAINDAFKEEYGLESQFLVCYKVKFHEDTNGLDALINLEIKADLPVIFDELLKKEKL